LESGERLFHDPDETTCTSLLFLSGTDYLVFGVAGSGVLRLLKKSSMKIVAMFQGQGKSSSAHTNTIMLEQLEKQYIVGRFEDGKHEMFDVDEVLRKCTDKDYQEIRPKFPHAVVNVDPKYSFELEVFSHESIFSRENIFYYGREGCKAMCLRKSGI